MRGTAPAGAWRERTLPRGPARGDRGRRRRAPRVLVVQRTGWGKSLVYFIATSLLRDRGCGPDAPHQPAAVADARPGAEAGRLGVRAATIDSANVDEWDEVERALAADEVDVLLVSPERLGNERFRARTLGRSRRHRPVRRRRGALHLRLGPRLPPRLPAHRRASPAAAAGRAGARDDGDRQRARHGRHRRAAGRGLAVIRGPLTRESSRLQVDRAGRPGRAAGLAGRAPAGVRRHRHRLLPDGRGLPSASRSGSQLEASTPRAYYGDLEADERRELEERCAKTRSRRWWPPSPWGWASTSRTSGFVVHFQRPGSVDRLLPADRSRRPRARRRRVVLLTGARTTRSPTTSSRPPSPPRTTCAPSCSRSSAERSPQSRAHRADQPLGRADR